MSTEEWEKIKDAVLPDLQKLIHSLAESKPQKRSIWDILNTPVVVALVSGGVLSGLVTLWQNNTAKNQRAESRRIELQDRRERAFVEFADHFPKSVAVASEYKMREAYLNDHIKQPPARRPLYYDGNSYDETRVTMNALKAEFLKGRMPDSICGNILTSFQTVRVLESTRALRKKCDELIESFNTTNIYALNLEINRHYKVVLINLEQEIRTDIP